MKIVVGKYSGFCAGVNYTYNRAIEELKKGNLYCLGDIIHNEHVISHLKSIGMTTIYDIKDIKDNSRVIFRAHGEPISSYEYAKEHNLDIIDLTCGKVKLIHNKVLKEKEESFIIVIGKKKHPETIGTVGFIINDYYVVENEDDINVAYSEFAKSKKRKIFVISQTTFSSSYFDFLCDAIIRKFNNIEIKIDKSICAATENRQKECETLSKKSSVMLVIGSKNSSNTKELYNIAIDNCKVVYFIEFIDELKNYSFSDNDIIGVVAGASTPLYLIEETKKYLESTCL